MNVPKVTAPGPGILVVTFLNHSTNSTNKPTIVTTNVTYFTPIDWALSKRPYIHETSGDILLRLDANYFKPDEMFTISASLPAGDARWIWNLVATHATFPNYILPLSFERINASSTTVHNDLKLTVLRLFDNTKFVQSRRFHKVPPPPLTNTVVPVQVDHTTQGLLVNGTRWVGHGWFMQALPNNDWTALAEYIKRIFVPMGVNVAMPYGLGTQPLDVQTTFLDAMASIDFKIMYHTGSMKLINRGGPFNNASLLANLKANITTFQHHPAILGWYICGDCCSDTPDISLQAQVYQLIKDMDPYHVTIGAANCGNSWMFTDTAPSWLTPKQDLSANSIAQATQPQLQLSLDVVMQENYVHSLPTHGDDGTWEGGVGGDGFYRHGVEFEALWNCPGSGPSACNRYKDPNMLLTAQWLSLITAGMKDQLVFDSDYTNSSQFIWKTQVGLFAQRVAVLEDAVSAPFGSVVHPTTTVVSLKQNIKARSWFRPSMGAFPCLGYVVVANTNEKKSHIFEVQVVKEGICFVNASRMFSTLGSVGIDSKGFFRDEIMAGDTNVYCIS